MKTQFTPGPWALREKETDLGSKYYRIETKPFFALAEVNSGEQSKANAHLIAASPDLYACLKELLDSANNELCDDYITDNGKKFIESVLKKARGE